MTAVSWTWDEPVGENLVRVVFKMIGERSVVVFLSDH